MHIEIRIANVNNPSLVGFFENAQISQCHIRVLLDKYIFTLSINKAHNASRKNVLIEIRKSSGLKS